VAALELHSPLAAFLFRERGTAMRWVLSSARAVARTRVAQDISDENFIAILKLGLLKFEEEK